MINTEELKEQWEEEITSIFSLLGPNFEIRPVVKVTIENNELRVEVNIFNHNERIYYSSQTVEMNGDGEVLSGEAAKDMIKTVYDEMQRLYAKLESGKKELEKEFGWDVPNELNAEVDDKEMEQEAEEKLPEPNFTVEEAIKDLNDKIQEDIISSLDPSAIR